MSAPEPPVHELPVEPAAARTLTQPALADLAGATSRWVRSGDVRLHLLDFGPPDAVPVLIVPGITTPAVAMAFVARELTDLVRPIILDVRGRGLSDNAPADADGPLRGYDLVSYATDVRAVLAELGLERPILLGHSMGARIAAVVAADGRSDLRGTVLVDPPTCGPDRGTYPTTLEAFLGQLDQARRGTDADAVAASWPTWPRREQELRARWLASCSRTAITATHAGFETEDFFDTWPQVPAPTAIVYGGDSPVFPAPAVEEAGKANPGADLVEVPGVGHMVFWDDPVTALGVVRDVLRGMLQP